MDIDPGVLRSIERENEIPYAELVQIIEAAIASNEQRTVIHL